MGSKIERILPLLQCPRTKTALEIVGQELVSEGGERYPIIDGKPILVRHIEALHTTPPHRNFISGNAADFKLNNTFPPDAVVINLGCGDVPAADPRVLSLDILPISSADIVAEGEALPFKENSVDLVVSGAVFEHLHSPLDAIAEVRRVLKEGGEFFIDTAFMLTYHRSPSHYFNMTPQAIETYLVDDFHLTGSVVAKGGSVVNSMSNLLGRLLSALPEAGAERIRQMKVGDFQSALMAKREKSNDLVAGLSEYSHRAMAASYSVRGRKPLNYREGVARAEATIGRDAWKSLKRRYYSARNSVMLTYHEIDYYRRATSEAGIDMKDNAARELSDYLHDGAVADPTSVESWSLAVTKLDNFVGEMTKIRNQWIGRYQSAKALALRGRSEVDRPPSRR